MKLAIALASVMAIVSSYALIGKFNAERDLETLRQNYTNQQKLLTIQQQNNIRLRSELYNEKGNRSQCYTALDVCKRALIRIDAEYYWELTRP